MKIKLWLCAVALIATSCGTQENNKTPEDDGGAVTVGEQEPTGASLTFPVPVPPDEPPVIIDVDDDGVDVDIDVSDCRGDREKIARKWWKHASKWKKYQRSKGGKGLKICWRDWDDDYKWEHSRRERDKRQCRSSKVFCIGDNN